MLSVLTLKRAKHASSSSPERTRSSMHSVLGGGGAYDPSDGLWKPNKDGLGLGHVFDEINKDYGEDFLRYKPLDNEED